MTAPPLADLVAALPADKRAAVAARAAWLARARPKQVPPPGDWTTCLILAGRGFGKSLLASQEAWWRAAWHDGHRVAVVAPTAGDLRRTCFEGESGILRCVPPACLEGGDPAAAYNRSLFELRFANGSLIQGFSAAEPDRLRGPNHHFAICDELAAWDRADEAWSMLSLTLRLGDRPQIVATTTPRPVPIIRDLLARAGDDVLLVRGSTFENRANLAPGFIAQLEARFAGTRLGRQELEAELLEDVAGTLWPRILIEAARVAAPPASFRRIVVGVDPSGASGEDDERADEIGIVAAGVGYDDVGYILEDASGRYSPEGWARKVIEVFDRWQADRIVAEKNFGGALVESMIQTARRHAPITMVTASRGKVARAEPVAALFEQGRVKIVGAWPVLEDQFAAFTRAGYQGRGSPDHADAALWSLTDLMLTGADAFDSSYAWVS